MPNRVLIAMLILGTVILFLAGYGCAALMEGLVW